MNRTPYSVKKVERAGFAAFQYELYFQSGECELLVDNFDSEREAYTAENIANNAYHQGRLLEIHARKHALNIEKQQLHDLLDNM